MKKSLNRTSVLFWIFLGSVTGLLSLLWVLVAKTRTRTHALYYIISLLSEAEHQYRDGHIKLAQHLFRAAAAASRFHPLPHKSFLYNLQQLNHQSLSNLFDATSGNVLASHLPLVILGLLIMLVTMYWWLSLKVERIDHERRELRDRLLAITGIWMEATIEPDKVQETLIHIFAQLERYGIVCSAEVYRVTTRDRHSALKSYCRFRDTGILSILPIPAAFLDRALSGVGEALESGHAWYSGDDGEKGVVFPGLRRRKVAVFPLMQNESVWGILVLEGSEANWFVRHWDLLILVAQEIGLLVINADLAIKARQAELYQGLARMRSEILANVSHELRTPLGLIKGYSETLLSSKAQLSQSEVDEFLGIIFEESTQLERLIDNILRMSSIENAGIRPHKTWFLLSNWIEQAIRKIVPSERGRIVVTAIPFERMFGDSQQLLEVLINLLENALKYSEDAVVLQIQKNYQGITIIVRDQGTGIPEAELGHIFERFYRASEHAQSSIRGSGLGLSIAKRIVEAHGGEIRAFNGEVGFVVECTIPQSNALARLADV